MGLIPDALIREQRDAVRAAVKLLEEAGLLDEFAVGGTALDGEEIIEVLRRHARTLGRSERVAARLR